MSKGTEGMSIFVFLPLQDRVGSVIENNKDGSLASVLPCGTHWYVVIRIVGFDWKFANLVSYIKAYLFKDRKVSVDQPYEKVFDINLTVVRPSAERFVRTVRDYLVSINTSRIRYVYYNGLGENCTIDHITDEI